MCNICGDSFIPAMFRYFEFQDNRGKWRMNIADDACDKCNRWANDYAKALRKRKVFIYETKQIS